MIEECCVERGGKGGENIQSTCTCNSTIHILMRDEKEERKKFSE